MLHTLVMFVFLTFFSTNLRSRFTLTEFLSLPQEQVGSRPGNENNNALEIDRNKKKHKIITNTSYNKPYLEQEESTESSANLENIITKTTNNNKPYLEQEESTESSANLESIITKTTNYNKPYIDKKQSTEYSVKSGLNFSYCDINKRRNETVSTTMDYFTDLKRETLLGLSLYFLLHSKKRLFHHEHISHSINSTAPDRDDIKLMNHSVINSQAPVTRQQHMLKDSKFQNSTLNVKQKRNKNDLANNGNNASCVDVCGSFLSWPSCSCDVRCFVHRSFCENITSACANLTQDVEKRLGKKQIRTGAVCNYELNEYVVNECNNKTDMQSGQFSELSSIRDSICVTDNETGIIYKNYQIYQCYKNTDSSPLFWSVKVEIDPLLNVWSTKDLTYTIATAKNFFLPPNGPIPSVDCFKEPGRKDFKFSMIVNVANDHVIEITRATPMPKEWTKSECKENGRCNHKTCRNHIALWNDVCVFEFSYQISIIHPPSRLLDYKTITDLANYLLRCIFLRSSLVLAARVARVHSKFKANNGENLLSHFGEVFRIVVDVNGTMDQDVEWKIKNGLHQYFEQTSLIRLYANENALKNGSFVSTYQNSTEGTVWFCYIVVLSLKSKPPDCYTPPTPVLAPYSNLMSCHGDLVLNETG